MPFSFTVLSESDSQSPPRNQENVELPFLQRYFHAIGVSLHFSILLERQGPGDHGVEDRQHDQAVDEEAEDDGGEVPAQLHQHLPEVTHAQHLGDLILTKGEKRKLSHLASDEEEDSYRCQVDHPGGDHLAGAYH